MRHLSPDTFIDLLDGTRAESDVPHLTACEECRRQLAGLRETWQAAVETSVPEPSPLFWDQFSARVHESVAADAGPRAPWWRAEWSWSSFGLAGAAVAAVALVVFLQLSRTGGVASGVPSGAVAPAAMSSIEIALDPLPALPDDESIGFVADLASSLDWDGVAEVGLAVQGGADRAVAELNADERAELRRLLTEAVGQSDVL